MSKDEKKDQLQAGDIIYEVVHKAPIHSWIHAGNDAQIVHAATGKKIQAVTRTPFSSYTSHGLSVILLRCQNEQLRNLIVQISKLWSPILTTDEVKSLVRLNLTENNATNINIWREIKRPITPYADNRIFSKDFNILEANVFRAVQAALRTGLIDDKTEPLSKIRGVSCNQFISFTIQAAAVLLLLGKNVQLLRTSVNKISQIGLKKVLTNTSYHQLLIQFMSEFKSLANESKISPGLKGELTKAIQFGSKGQSINLSMQFWRQMNFFEEKEGTLALVEDTMILEQTPMSLPPDPVISVNEAEESASDVESETKGEGEESEGEDPFELHFNTSQASGVNFFRASLVHFSDDTRLNLNSTQPQQALPARSKSFSS